jgi:hypothetical protein
MQGIQFPVQMPIAQQSVQRLQRRVRKGGAGPGTGKIGQRQTTAADQRLDGAHQDLASATMHGL